MDHLPNNLLIETGYLEGEHSVEITQVDSDDKPLLNSKNELYSHPLLRLVTLVSGFTKLKITDLIIEHDGTHDIFGGRKQTKCYEDSCVVKNSREVTRDDGGGGDAVTQVPMGKKNVLTIWIKNQMGRKLEFKVKTTTKMNKIFSAYAKKTWLELETLEFRFNGDDIKANETRTISDLQLEDCDEINVTLVEPSSTFLYHNLHYYIKPPLCAAITMGYEKLRNRAHIMDKDSKLLVQGDNQVLFAKLIALQILITETLVPNNKRKYYPRVAYNRMLQQERGVLQALKLRHKGTRGTSTHCAPLCGPFEYLC